MHINRVSVVLTLSLSVARISLLGWGGRQMHDWRVAKACGSAHGSSACSLVRLNDSLPLADGTALCQRGLPRQWREMSPKSLLKSSS